MIPPKLREMIYKLVCNLIPVEASEPSAIVRAFYKENGDRDSYHMLIEVTCACSSLLRVCRSIHMESLPELNKYLKVENAPAMDSGDFGDRLRLRSSHLHEVKTLATPSHIAVLILRLWDFNYWLQADGIPHMSRYVEGGLINLFPALKTLIWPEGEYNEELFRQRKNAARQAFGLPALKVIDA